MKILKFILSMLLNVIVLTLRLTGLAVKFVFLLILGIFGVGALASSTSKY